MYLSQYSSSLSPTFPLSCCLPTGLLLYFSDGILPLLRIYFKEFFNPNMETDQVGRLAISANILTALLVGHDMLKWY